VIEECVRSVCTQSHKELEIILIDDGSTDKTVEICRNLAAQDSRILLLEPGHTGVSGARNVGLDAATGEYVFFVDSDDVIHPLLLQTLCEAMEASHAAMGGTRVINIAQSQWDAVPALIARHSGPGETSFHSFAETIHNV
jgi:glycosyltransferase involved in cell wall biosynthesis